jgi:hypothetical protein
MIVFPSATAVASRDLLPSVFGTFDKMTQIGDVSVHFWFSEALLPISHFSHKWASSHFLRGFRPCLTL